jgi:hypothetical protein
LSQPSHNERQGLPGKLFIGPAAAVGGCEPFSPYRSIYSNCPKGDSDVPKIVDRYPVAANIIIAAAIIILALVGAALQNRKKEALQPDAWLDWERKTSYWPFGAIVSARLAGFSMQALAGGVVLWLAATWAHIPLAGWPAGIWRWL